MYQYIDPTWRVGRASMLGPEHGYAVQLWCACGTEILQWGDRERHQFECPSCHLRYAFGHRLLYEYAAYYPKHMLVPGMAPLTFGD